MLFAARALVRRAVGSLPAGRVHYSSTLAASPEWFSHVGAATTLNAASTADAKSVAPKTATADADVGASQPRPADFVDQAGADAAGTSYQDARPAAPTTTYSDSGQLVVDALSRPTTSIHSKKLWVNHPSLSPDYRQQLEKRQAAYDAKHARSLPKFTLTGRKFIALPRSPSTTIVAKPAELMECQTKLTGLLAHPPRSTTSHSYHNALWALYLRTSFLVPVDKLREYNLEVAQLLTDRRSRMYLEEKQYGTARPRNQNPNDDNISAEVQEGNMVRISALPQEMLNQLIVRLAPPSDAKWNDAESLKWESYPVIKRYMRRSLAVLAQIRAQRISAGRSLVSTLIPQQIPMQTEEREEAAPQPQPDVAALVTVLEWATAQTQAHVIDYALALLHDVAPGTQADDVRKAVTQLILLLKRVAAHEAKFNSARKNQRGEPRSPVVWHPARWQHMEMIVTAEAQQALDLLTLHGQQVDEPLARHVLDLYARTSNLDRVLVMLQEYWDVDLMRLDAPPRGDAPPLPTKIFNTLLFALGQELPASEMVAAFHTLTTPLPLYAPQANTSKFSDDTEEDGTYDEAKDSHATGDLVQGRNPVRPSIESYEILVHHLVNPIKDQRYTTPLQERWEALLPQARVRESFEMEQRRRSRGSYVLLMQSIMDQALDHASNDASDIRKRVLTALAVENRPSVLRQAGIKAEDLIEYLPEPSTILVPTKRLLKWVLHLSRDRAKVPLINYSLAYINRWLETMTNEQMFFHEASTQASTPVLHKRLVQLQDVYTEPMTVVQDLHEQFSKKLQAIQNKKVRKLEETGFAPEVEMAEKSMDKTPGKVEFIDVTEFTGNTVYHPKREAKLRSQQRKELEAEQNEQRRQELLQKWLRDGRDDHSSSR